MHRLKATYVLRTTNEPEKKYTEPKDPFEPKLNHTYDPERLSDNGTLYRQTNKMNAQECRTLTATRMHA